MACWLLFCTSPEVTPQLVRECQSAHDISSVVNIFAPARLDANAQKATSRTEVDDHVEVFEHATDSQLREIFTDRGGLSTWEHRPPFEGGYFAVLDDRSVRDETLEIHAKHTEFVGEYADDDIDYGTEVAAEYWLKWRVSISECWTMLALMGEVGGIEDLFVDSKMKFTNSAGVFSVKDALAWHEAPARAHDWRAKLSKLS